MEEPKREAMEVVKLIRDKIGEKKNIQRILRGVLLFGPPGCGKTYLVKAIATESGLPFLSMSGSEFTEMYVGVGAGRVRKLFKQARELAQIEGGCIIFIDEIDAVGATRSQDISGGQSERNTTLNQLLVEMDGLKNKADNITVFAATNMSERFIDTALLRPGRFDRKIFVDLPDLEERKKLFTYYFIPEKTAKDIEVDRLGRLTVGNTPAEIANIVQEAAMISQRKGAQVSMKEVNEARERIALGVKRRMKMSPAEKERAAFHEAGHLLVTYLLVPSKEVFKASIVPRGQTAGAVWLMEKEDMIARDKNLLLGEIKIAFSGYVAEKLKFGTTSNGVESDFRDATVLAHNMAWRWGMGKSGHVGNFEPGEGRVSWYSLQADLDHDAQDIIMECMAESEDAIRRNWQVTERIAALLVEKEELEFYEIEELFKGFGMERKNTEAGR
jgi:cell division protease FtsH